MYKQFVKLLSVFTLCISLLIGVTDSTKAQSISPSKATISDQIIKFQSDADVVTWEMLGFGETNLAGPYDSSYFSFNLPADWELTEGASLNLSLGISVSTGIQDQSNSATTEFGQPNLNGVVGMGTMSILINNTTVINLALDQVGEVVTNIPIPIDVLTSSTDEGLVEVYIVLNSGTSCFNFDQMNVLIRTSSNFILPHETIRPSTDLMNFPRPIYQSSFIPDSALIITPNQPSAGDLQAALTLASGLGKLSNGSLALDMVTLDKLTAEQQAANDLIFVGKSASLPVLRQLELPLPVIDGQFQVFEGGADDGFVEMVNSPWNNANIILIVSGNSDQGTIKAAQAVSTGVFQVNESPNLAVVQEVKTTPVLTPRPTDQTLTALGYRGRLFENRGVGNATYNFIVPPGWTVASDSSFELVFGHSALLDYSSSGIVVLLNGKPIGSVRMSDASAALSMNKVLVNIPVSAVVPGKNRLDVRVNLEQEGICSPPDMRGLWVNIWPESTLHLPLDLTLIDASSIFSLASYPAPFIYYPLLDNTAFVLMHDDLESWRAAVTIASTLGSITNGPVTALNVYYGDDLPEADRSKHNFLIIGRPSQMPIMAEINRALPIPFLDGSDILAGGNFQVTYRIPPDSPIGYMELLPSPWNPDNVVLAVLGNTTQGVGWATSSLINPDLRSKLSGNFAVINDQLIITADTRLTPTINLEPTQAPEVVVNPLNVDTNSVSPAVQQSTWVFPLFFASIVLIILISAIVAIGSWSRYRTRGNPQRSDYQPSGRGFFSSIKKLFNTFFEKTKKRRKDN